MNKFYKKIKLAIIDMDDLRNPHWGFGQARATREVAKRILRSYRVIVYCSKYPGWKNYREDGIYYKHIGFSTNNSFVNNIGFILSLPFVVPGIKADIIIENFTAPISTCFVPVFTKVPVVGIPTTYEAERFTQKYHLPFHLIEQFGSRFYKYFLPYTDFLDKKMKRINPSVVSKVVPEGVGSEYFRIKRKKAKYILFIGRYDIKQKGIDLLLKAYCKYREKEEWPLVIVGCGSDRQKIVNMVNALGLGQYVTVKGAAYGKEKEKLLSEALYVVFPSRVEGFSLFSLEAIASGLPLVAFDIPALSWADDSIAFKARPFNIHEYAGLLEKASDVKLLKPMRKRCRDVSRLYSWKNVALAFDLFIKEILDSNIQKKYKL